MLTDARASGRPLAAAVLVAAAGTAGCESGTPEGVLVLEPDSVIAAYPSPEAEEPPVLGHLSAIAVADDDIYVADQQAGRVHRFTRDGRYVNALGRQGEGPGELQRPSEVEVGPDGTVWVADPPSGRVTRFRPDGRLHSLRRAPFGATDFGIVPGDRMIVPSPTPDHLLAVVAPGDEITELAPGPGTPSSLAATPGDRFGFMGLFLEADPGSGDVYLLLNRDDYGLWRLRADRADGRVAGVQSLEIPAWVAGPTEARREEQREGLDDAGLQYVPFNDLALTSSGVWMTTGPIGALGVGLPTEDGRPPVVVRPSDEGGGDGRFEGVLHDRLEPDGLYAVFATRVKVFALDTVGVREPPDLW